MPETLQHLIANGRWGALERAASTMVARDGSTRARVLLVLALAHQGRLRAAEAAAADVFAGIRALLDDGDAGEALACAELMMKYVRDHRVHGLQIAALLALGRNDDARGSFDRLSESALTLKNVLPPEVGRHFADRLRSRTVIDLMDDDVNIDRPLLSRPAVARFDFGRRRIETREAYVEVLREHLFSKIEVPPGCDLADARICAFGSCFASRIVQSLQQQGVDAQSLLIEESVNSTFANRYFLEAALGAGEATPMTRTIREHFGDETMGRARDVIAGATDIILTVGVAPCLFDEDGSFVLVRRNGDGRRRGTLRTTTLDENLDNLQRVFGLLASVNPDARTFVTVSPVPLFGTTEFSSVLIGDCVSKSILRAAVHALTVRLPQLIYWPAFEAIKWLGAHSAVSGFGEGSEDLRHPADWLADVVVSEFVAKAFQVRDAG